MGQMKELWENINYALDTYIGAEYKSCEEIADELKCPVEWVNEVVEQRWEEAIGK
jgi:uncharacterized protein (DUF111 family)